jgi:hypothetical protein
MALNLWKTGGAPTSYTPVPYLSTQFALQHCPTGDLVIKFYAYSPTGKSLRLKLNTANNTFWSQAMTTSRTLYQVSFNNSIDQVLLFSGGGPTDTDVVVDGIELVQKPLPALTINGIDGFNSGKWSFHANVTVLDNESISFVGTGSAVSFANSDFINVASGQDVVLSIGISNVVYAYLKGFDSSGTQIFVSTAVNSISATGDDGRKYLKITIPSNVVKIKFQIEANATSNTVITSRPTVNLGSSPAPYEAKKGDRMVMPISSGKNLSYLKDIKANVVTTTILGNQVQSILLSSIKVKPNTTYTLSLTKDPVYKTIKVVTQYDNINTSQMGHNSLYSSTAGANKGRELDVVNEVFTFTTTANENFVSITTGNATTGFGTTLTYSNIQLEEGSVATPYTPYAVQGNKKPMKYVSKKNLFNMNSVIKGYSLATDGLGTINVNSTFCYSDYIPVKPNTNYTKTVTNGGEFYTASKVPLSGMVGSTFTTSSSTYFIRLNVPLTALDTMQLEEGSTATAYEPYTPVLPKALNGLAFNGVSDYITAPIPTPQKITLFADFKPYTVTPISGSTAVTVFRKESSFILQWSTNLEVKPHVFLEGGSSYSIAVSGAGKMVANVRQTLAMTYDGSVIIGYLNGVEVCRTTANGTSHDNINLVHVGKSPSGQAEYFNGEMYKSKAFSRALTPDEILSLHTNSQLKGDVFDYDFTDSNNIVANTVLNQVGYVSNNLLVGTSNPN